MMEDVARHLKAQLIGEIQLHTGTGAAYAHAGQCQQKEAEGEHGKEIGIQFRDALVYHQLQIERAADRRELQTQGENEELRNRHVEAGVTTEQIEQPRPQLLPLGLQRPASHALDGDAGKVPTHLAQGILTPPDCRIMNDHSLRGHAAQYDEVVHVPVQNCR